MTELSQFYPITSSLFDELALLIPIYEKAKELLDIIQHVNSNQQDAQRLTEQVVFVMEHIHGNLDSLNENHIALLNVLNKTLEECWDLIYNYIQPTFSSYWFASFFNNGKWSANIDLELEQLRMIIERAENDGLTRTHSGKFNNH